MEMCYIKLLKVYWQITSIYASSKLEYALIVWNYVLTMNFIFSTRSKLADIWHYGVFLLNVNIITVH